MSSTRRLVIAIALSAVLTPNAIFAGQSPRSESGDVRPADRDNALTRIVKIIRRLIVIFDEPQGPPPTVTH
jgi:hypothetical protein